MDVENWRICTLEETRTLVKGISKRAGDVDRALNYRSFLIVRQRLSPVDIFCYLKGRFGPPNGIQTLLRKDDSDNWIHWDYQLKAAEADVYLSGTYREVHIMLSENLTDNDWVLLLEKIKSDYSRVGTEKSAIFRSLERWLVFSNKFVNVAGVCAELHGDVVDDIEKLPFEGFPMSASTDTDETQRERLRGLAVLMSRLYRNCLELSLISPVLAEAFINMTILILCKPEIRDNPRQIEAFLRSQIDIKVFDLFYKCRGFVKPISAEAEEYKAFKRVMDKRNYAIHGNIDPEKDQIEVVFFEGKRPLFKDPGDHISKVFDAKLRQANPQAVLREYEEVHLFFSYIASCLEPELQEGFWQIVEDATPGYDPKRGITGKLLPNQVFTGHVVGIRYDDELAPN